MEEVGSWIFPRAAPLELGLFRRFHGTCTHNNVLYVFGGETKITNAKKGPPVKRLLNDLLVYSPDDNTWTVLDYGTQEAPSRRKGVQLAMCQRNQSLYLFGGAGPGIYYNDLWRFDLIEQRWYNESTKCLEVSLLEDVAYPAPRAYHITEIWNDNKLIVFGGYGLENESECLWEYDIACASWRSLGAPGSLSPGLRFGLQACIYKGGMYICTGQQGNRLVSTSLWRLDLTSGNYIWQQLATSGAPPTQRTYSASVLVEMKLPAGLPLAGRWILHGGSSADTVFSDTYELDLDTLHWHPCLHLSTVPTIEGHSLNVVQTSWGSTSLFLLGGASSGPTFPAGPLARCDLFLSGWQLGPETSHLKLEDFAIKLPALSEMIWYTHRLRLELEENAQKSELEEENQRLKQLVKSHQFSNIHISTIKSIRSSLENAFLTLASAKESHLDTDLDGPLSTQYHRIPEEVQDHQLLGYLAKLSTDLAVLANHANQHLRNIAHRMSPRSHRPEQIRSIHPVTSRLQSVETEVDCQKSVILSPLTFREPRQAVTRAVACGSGTVKIHKKQAESQ